MSEHKTGTMRYLACMFFLLLPGMPLVAQEAAEAQASEEAVPTQSTEQSADPAEEEPSVRTPTIPEASPTQRPRDVFRPSEEIWADSAISFPVDI